MEISGLYKNTAWLNSINLKISLINLQSLHLILPCFVIRTVKRRNNQSLDAILNMTFNATFAYKTWLKMLIFSLVKWASKIATYCTWCRIHCKLSRYTADKPLYKGHAGPELKGRCKGVTGVNTSKVYWLYCTSTVWIGAQLGRKLLAVVQSDSC